jgi:glucokinase
MAKAKTAAVSLEPLAIGIDIGGTGTKFGIVDRNGNVLFSSEISTRGHGQVESFIDELHKNLLALIDKSGGPGRIRGIGVGAPNGNFYSGTVEYAPNLPWKGIIPLAKLIENKFHLPTILTNDANAAAIGEMMYGAAKGMKDFIMITLLEMTDLPASWVTPLLFLTDASTKAPRSLVLWKVMRRRRESP